MDSLDDSETNAKISDSAYSNSCSNSQSRRSHSSKSTHSGSNSSGSSGYGGKLSAYNDNSGLPIEKRIKEKDGKKTKQVQLEKTVEVLIEAEEKPPEPAPVIAAVIEEINNVESPPSPEPVQAEKSSETIEIATPDGSSSKDEVGSCSIPIVISANYVSTRSAASNCADGFTCVISMLDGVVMYTTNALTTTLGFPKDMWIGRSFIDFVHPRDRNSFASQITSGLAVPKNVNGTLEEVPSTPMTPCTMVCRIRRYRNLTAGFGVKERTVTFMPFLLKLTFKSINDENGQAMYLVIQATPFFSAFKTPNEVVVKPVPFIIRHTANGSLEYIDPESVPYLGYLPQDLAEKDALQLYHPEDLPYLRLVYKMIVREGGVPRDNSYRMIAQNGDFIKVETEWSSFINPWSRKLEFVIGKHYIIEGPSNPDVFQTPEIGKNPIVNEEERKNINALKESIIRIMNEVLTKPAEVAKQQMTKRCQDLASFMESLMEEQPKPADELQLDIQDPDHSYFERDSVMLGGISPHHDQYDSKSSTETPLSYNQLNYNETLQRYFDCHQFCSQEEINRANEGNTSDLNNFKPDGGNCCLSSVARTSGESLDISSSESGRMIGGNSSSIDLGDHMRLRLTESLLNKHNSEMEKILKKIHREARSISRGEREKMTDTRQKKKEHLARCNATFQPTSARNDTTGSQPHGVKRTCKHLDNEGTHKHQCSSQRHSRRRPSTSLAPAPTSAAVTNTAAAPWPGSSMNGMNTFFLGVGIPQNMSTMSPVTAMPGMIPMYYAPAAIPPGISSDLNVNHPTTSTAQIQQLTQMQYMMYGQAVYGSPFLYSPMAPQMTFPIPQNNLAQTINPSPINYPLGLASSNFEEACKPSLSLKPKNLAGSQWRQRKQTMNPGNSSSSLQTTNFSSKALNRSTEAVSGMMRDDKTKNGEETIDKTDGESSYSSSYSSFFKTESSSAEDWKSVDVKKVTDQDRNKTKNHYEPQTKRVARRRMQPPWMDQVCMTSELVYKYQILTKSIDEVLKADKEKMMHLEQPSLVNEQLGQLYLDLQLEGVASRLTLEEGVTSSSSSGEESSSMVSKIRRKREYSKLVMIYEEDAPLPPSPDEYCCPGTSAEIH